MLQRVLVVTVLATLGVCSCGRGSPRATDGAAADPGVPVGEPGLPTTPVPVGPDPAPAPICPLGLPVACDGYCCPSGDTCGDGLCLLSRRPLRCPATHPVFCGPQCCPLDTECDADGLCVVPRITCPATDPTIDCGDGTCCPVDALCGVTACTKNPYLAPNQPGRSCTLADSCGSDTGPCCDSFGDPALAGTCIGGACARPGTPYGCYGAETQACGTGACCPDGATCGVCGCPSAAPTSCGASCCGAEAFCGAEPDTCLACDAASDYPVPCAGDGCCLAGGVCAAGRCTCPASTLECGDVCCAEGETCASDGGCCPAGFPEPCGEVCCAEGDRCVDGACLGCTDARPVLCGDDLCCADDEPCTLCPGEDEPQCGECDLDCEDGTHREGDRCVPDDTVSCTMSGHSVKTCPDTSQKCCLDAWVCCVGFGELDCNPPAFCD